MSELPAELKTILAQSFALRTTFARRDGTPRTLETTFGWSGAGEVVLSGFPGKRDWVASLARSPEVQVHTVQTDTDSDGLGDPCDPTPVPEPGAFSLLVAGCLVLTRLHRRDGVGSPERASAGLEV